MKPRTRFLAATLLGLLTTFQAFSADLPPDAKKAFDDAFKLRQYGQSEKALEAYEKAIAIAPESSDIWLEYTGCLRHCRRLQRAVQAGWRTMELAPEDAGMWGNLGNIFVQARSWDAARAAFEKAELLSKDKRWSAQNFVNLGYRQWVDGQNGAAIRNFEHAVKIDPSHGLAVLDIGATMVTQGKLQEGEAKMKEGADMLALEKNQKGINYAKLVLGKVQQDKSLQPPPLQTLTSTEQLPERFLKQPPKGTALTLPVDPTVRRIFSLDDGHEFSLQIPESMLEKIQLPPDVSAAALALRPAHQNTYEILISPALSSRGLPEIKKLLTDGAEPAVQKSVEQKLDLIEIKSPTAEGYAYCLSDKDLVNKPAEEGKYAYVIQAMVKSGPTEIAVTVLSRSKDKKFVDEMIEILKSLSAK